MEAKIVKKSSFHVIGYHFVANLKEIEEQQLSKKTLERLQFHADKIPNKIGDHVYLIQVYPMKEGFHPYTDKFTQIIGYEVSNPGEVPEGGILHTVPNCTYVTTTHKGPEAEIYQTYDYLYGKWMVENRCMPLGYDFELWDERYNPDDMDNEIDLFIAINK
ncbi:Predicted transcriptional regulator YdeE, contains AraC-type DNA-binding domain [Oceanobacillus limi]|uniref:Predicted transcriptional regulator YdeE, contains AraC-type DNA-binding domain n=1 Tax=Oceanobacillus limi TaxID=930131 RepID=A0A1I0FC32_9BACI|nr:effector binding domain-containing protein [Oceanobacillus limi]SET54901.1 Predicted transcriptional regulator YdeE, contains AraC-type DNA-binding domain [Oceanobacillus limi]